MKTTVTALAIIFLIVAFAHDAVLGFFLLGIYFLIAVIQKDLSITVVIKPSNKPTNEKNHPHHKSGN